MDADKRQYRDVSSVLEVNRPLQVVIKAEKSPYVYKSSVADFDRGNILITPLTREGRPAQLRNGEKIDVIYFGHDAMYTFETNVTGRKKENKVMLTILEKPHKCWRIQRRGFFRLPYKAEASFRKVMAKIQDGRRAFSPVGNAFPCHLNDISGGGVSFRTREVLDDDSFVAIEFSLPSGDEELYYREIVKIIRTRTINPLGRKGESEYIYSAHFVSIDNEKQTEIIHFIFQRQIQEKKVSRKSL